MKNISLLRIALIIPALLGAWGAAAQDDFAVIRDDPDGYVNVRKGGSHSEIIGTVQRYMPFYRIDPDEAQEGYPPQPGMTLINPYRWVMHRDGYMHILYLRTAEGWWDTDQCAFGYVHARHVMQNAANERLTAAEGYSGVESVDGLKPWGVDGNVPNEELRSVTVIWKGLQIPLPASAIRNIFEPSLGAEYTSVRVGREGELYIWMQNSDGAGGYHVIWTVVGGRLVSMFVLLSWWV